MIHIYLSNRITPAIHNNLHTSLGFKISSAVCMYSKTSGSPNVENINAFNFL
jgi:hypothetical protein